MFSPAQANAFLVPFWAHLKKNETNLGWHAMHHSQLTSYRLWTFRLHSLPFFIYSGVNCAYKSGSPTVPMSLFCLLDTLNQPWTREPLSYNEYWICLLKCDLVTGRLREQPVVSFLGKTVVISVSSVINVLVTKVISKWDHLFSCIIVI